MMGGRRRVGEALAESCLEATVKHGGGSIQVWGCILLQGVSDIIKIEGKLITEKCRTILKQDAIPPRRRLIGNILLLQQNNDPKDTSRLV
ncbi:hypothetical protein Trydic_g11037 [Trypoxylus dichotomus]